MTVNKNSEKSLFSSPTEALQARDFRSLLQQELVRRCQRNPKYSLRAFAKMLGISSAYLSLILSGKRRIPEQTVLAMGKALGLDPDQIEKFQQKVASKKQSSEARSEAPEDYRQIALDHFQVIADWYHYAILELTKIQSFTPSPKWVASSLGISVNEVNDAVERLIRLEMLQISSSGQWIDLSGDITNLDNEFVAVARRKLQKQILEKAIESLETIPVEKRDQSSMTMAVDSKLLPEAKKRLTQFRRQFSKFLESGSEKDKVFNLSISLYPVSHERKNS